MWIKEGKGRDDGELGRGLEKWSRGKREPGGDRKIQQQAGGNEGWRRTSNQGRLEDNEMQIEEDRIVSMR